MPKTRPPYPAAFREQMIELVQTGKPPGELSREFGCSALPISHWVGQRLLRLERFQAKALPVSFKCGEVRRRQGGERLGLLALPEPQGQWVKLVELRR
jgi:transposase